MPVSRRDFLSLAAAAGLSMALPRPVRGQSSAGIDRRAVVRRHNPVVRKADPFSALTVGNGSLAFTSDVTGLQTFPAFYDRQFPLCTAGVWGWHTTPLPAGLDIEKYRFKNYDTYGRPVGYATDSTGQTELFNWLRENPHKFHLGRIGFQLPGGLSDLTNIEQELDLWSGLLTSRFDLAGRTVRVRTVCHPDMDLLAVSVDSHLPVQIAFPYASNEINMADWKSPDRHQTQFTPGKSSAAFHRTLDEDQYEVRLAWSDGQLQRTSEHEFVLSPAGEFVCLFSQTPVAGDLPTFQQALDASSAHWEKFWTGGGCIDLSNCTDARAPELERRIVLSQYNTALHCAVRCRRRRRGLLFNTWYGKAHLEMHWWHGVHFAAWNRFELLERSLGLLSSDHAGGAGDGAAAGICGRIGGRRWWGLMGGIRRRRLRRCSSGSSRIRFIMPSFAIGGRPTKETLRQVVGDCV
jgi:protein-glucosylgalactosylhydroxylysine glucosidase